MSAWRMACACGMGLALGAGAVHASPIAYPLLAADAGDAPRLELAQRVITRTWGPSEDSVYVVVRVPEWRSEGGAMAMSAVLPGSGELYVGERSGWLFLFAEAAGWAAHLFLTEKADERRDEASAYAGNPNDPSSVWSLERWAAATQEDPAALAQLYTGDRDGFYDAIRDPRYAAGFASPDSRSVFEDLQASADRRRRYARYAVAGLVLNHALSAFDALRAARIHNLPLRRNLQLRIRPSFEDGAGWTAALEGSFR